MAATAAAAAIPVAVAATATATATVMVKLLLQPLLKRPLLKQPRPRKRSNDWREANGSLTVRLVLTFDNVHRESGTSVRTLASCNWPSLFPRGPASFLRPRNPTC
jgi:hypothetical protein